jgi:hypothetical protein
MSAKPPPDAKWYEKELTFHWLTATSTVLGMFGLVAAAFTYLWETFSDPELEVATPLVLELRCSDEGFKREDCWSAAASPARVFNVTAAFRLEAKGPKKQSISIDRARLKFSVATGPGQESARSIELQAFWSANLTPGTNVQRRQIVPVSLSGGDAVSQELWFVPVQRICAGAPGGTCDERVNFMHWFHFVNGIVVPRLSPNGSPPTKAHTATVSFEFDLRKNGVIEAVPVVKTCTLEFGETARLMVEAFEAKPLYITLPCAESFPPDRKAM